MIIQDLFENKTVAEGVEYSPVTQAITRRILRQRTDLLAKYGPEKVGNAIDEVADFVGDVEEIGSSDVSGWVRHVEQMLGNMQGVAEGEYKSRHIHRQEQNKKYDEYRRNQEAAGKKPLSRGDWAATQRKGQQGVAEGAGNIGAQIRAAYQRIYDQGDDAVEFAYYDSPIFAQYWDEYEGDLDSIIAEVDPSELQIILDELTSAAENQGVAEAIVGKPKYSEPHQSGRGLYSAADYMVRTNHQLGSHAYTAVTQVDADNDRYYFIYQKGNKEPVFYATDMGRFEVRTDKLGNRISNAIITAHREATDHDLEKYMSGDDESEWDQEQGVAEAGPFSYGSKAPRKGSVADLAAKKHKEQQKGKQPVEPKDQMVGVAKVITKGVAGGSEKHECSHCNGSGRMVRDPDIGTDQECFVCDGTGYVNDEQGVAEAQQVEEMDKSQTPPGRDGGHQFEPGPKVSKKVIKAVKKDPAKHLQDLFAKEYSKKKVKEQGVAEGSTTRGGFAGSASQAYHEIEWLKKKIASLPPTKEKQIRDLQRQIRELAIAFQKEGVAEGLEDLVQIEYWQQETMESGRWVKTKPIPRATAEKIVNSFERGEIVNVEQGVAEGYKPSAGELARDLIKLADDDFNKKYGMSKQQANQYYSSSKLKEQGVAEGRPDVMRHTGDKTVRVVRRGGKPIGEIGIDAEASPGQGQYYVKLYDGSVDLSGYDTAQEALEELRSAL
jgi:hypothetical protein